MATGRIPTTANSPLTAKGDLFGYSTTQARVAVGSDGETLVADSAATTGLRWQPDFSVGRNKLINADFLINQRAFSSTTTSGVYTFDRWITSAVDGTSTFTSETFTLGSAPVAGYEGKTFIQLVSTGQTLASAQTSIGQRIESVRTFAGQTVTVSFWAKANTGTPKIAVELGQNFGAGGSPSAFNPIYIGQATLSTSWARYSVTGTITSLSGKTIGTDGSDSLNLKLYSSAGTDLNARTGSLGIQSFTAQIWGVQVEAGSVATPFTTATGTLQGELAACQRYYYRHKAGAVYSTFGQGNARSTTNTAAAIIFPVPMRTAPTALDSGTASNYRVYDGQTATACTTLALEGQSDAYTGIVYTTVASGLTATRNYTLDANNTTSAYIGFTAEL